MLQYDKAVYELVCQNEKLYKFISEYAVDGSWLVRCNDYANALISNKLGDLLGLKSDAYPLEKLLNRTIVEEELLSKKELYNYSSPFIKKLKVFDTNGNGIQQTVKVAFFTASGEEWLVGCHKNIYQEYQSAEIIDKYKKIIQGTNLGTWEWNVQTGETVFNERWAEIVGYSLKELRPVSLKTWTTLCHPEDLKKSEEELQKHFNGESSYYEIECRMKHKKGHWVWVLDRGRVFTWTDAGEPEWMVGSHQEITARKEQELETKKYKELFEATTKAASIGFWEVKFNPIEPYWDAVTNRIYEAPDDYRIKLEEGISRYPEGPNRELIEKSFYGAVEKGESYDIEVQINTFKNNLKWVRAIGIPEFENGDCKRVYGLFLDIDKVKQEQYLKDKLMENTKDENNRLVNFAHIVSHNLRSHSNNFSMLTQMLSTDLSDEKKQKVFEMLANAASKLKDTTRHLDEIVDINLTLGDNFTSLNLKKYIDDAIQSQKTFADSRGVELINNIPDNLTIKGIPAYLESIALNFLSNAIKYTDPEKKERHVEITATEKPHEIKLIYSDNGLGINLEKHGTKLFGMYKTFHRNKDARGIGLFITKNQIEAMGGRVEVESTPGEGTRFTIYFQKP